MHLAIIQFVLVIGILMTMFFYFVFLRSPFLDRMLAMFVFLLAILTILFPDVSQQLANLVGVTRGVDLVIYLGMLGFFFLLIMFYSKILKVESSLTKLAREIAIREGTELKKEE